MLTRTAASIVVGFFTTIAVAWAGAVHIGWKTVTTFERQGECSITTATGSVAASMEAHDAWGASVILHDFARPIHGPILRADGPLRSWELHAIESGWQVPIEQGDRYSFPTAQLLAAGWPSRCLWCDFSVHAWDPAREPIGGAITLWTYDDSMRRGYGDWQFRPPGVLPFYPIWPAMLGNTLLFAFLWFVVLSGWRAFRRWRQHRRLATRPILAIPAGER